MGLRQPIGLFQLRAIAFSVDCKVWLTLLTLSISLSGCVTRIQVNDLETVSQVKQRSTVMIDQSSRQWREMYHRLRDQWTRHLEVFRHFEGRLFVTATMMTPALELARTKHHQSLLSLLPSEYEQLLKQRLHRLENEYVFFVTLSSSDLPKLLKVRKSMNALLGEDGIEDRFQTHLIINDQKLGVKKIDQLSFKRAQALIDDFPFISAVKTGYWISFERPEQFREDVLKSGVHSFKLRFSSPTATALLPWQVSIQ